MRPRGQLVCPRAYRPTVDDQVARPLSWAMREIYVVLTLLVISVLCRPAAAEKAEQPGIGTFKVASVTADGKPATLDEGSELWLVVRADNRWALARKVGEKVTTAAGRWQVRDGVRELHLNDDKGEVVLTMNLPLSVRGPMQYNSQLAGASRGGIAVRTSTAKRSFASKLGAFAKGVANVGLQITGAVIPGGTVLSNALGSALGSASKASGASKQ